MWFLALSLLLQGDRLISVGGQVRGVLTDSSAASPYGRRAEFYGFRCLRGLRIRVDVLSDWDNLALAVAPDGRVVVRDDDGGDEHNNASFDWTCPDDQLYRLGVASYHEGVGGPFTLRVAALNDVAATRLPEGFTAGTVVSVLRPDEEVRGTVPRDGARYQKHPITYYGFRCVRARVFRIAVTSQFDNLLFVFGPSGLVNMNDDARGTAARVLLRCPDDAAYRIGVAGQNPDDNGPFRLTLRDLSPRETRVAATAAPVRRINGMPAVFPGAVVEGTLRADSARFEGRPAFFYALRCQARLSLRIDVHSTWDNVAWVVSPAGRRVVWSDNAEGTSDARIMWKCPDDAVYRVGVGAFNEARVGDYVLRVTPTSLP